MVTVECKIYRFCKDTNVYAFRLTGWFVLTEEDGVISIDINRLLVPCN